MTTTTTSNTMIKPKPHCKHLPKPAAATKQKTSLLVYYKLPPTQATKSIHVYLPANNSWPKERNKKKSSICQKSTKPTQLTNVRVHVGSQSPYSASRICKCVVWMQYADTLLIVVHVEIQTPTNVCISTILLQLTRWLNGFRWLVGVKKEENPSSSNPFLPRYRCCRCCCARCLGRMKYSIA